MLVAGGDRLDPDFPLSEDLLLVRNRVPVAGDARAVGAILAVGVEANGRGGRVAAAVVERHSPDDPLARDRSEEDRTVARDRRFLITSAADRQQPGLAGRAAGGHRHRNGSQILTIREDNLVREPGIWSGFCRTKSGQVEYACADRRTAVY